MSGVRLIEMTISTNRTPDIRVGSFEDIARDCEQETTGITLTAQGRHWLIGLPEANTPI